MKGSTRPHGPPSFDGFFDIVAIASSAGGLTALGVLVNGFPVDLEAAIVAVQHLSPDHKSVMAELLAKKTSIKTTQAVRGETLSPAHLYIAPPNHHLLVEPDGTLELTQTELVHYVRPSADLLFESVAATYRERALAVVLTGTGVDASMGVVAIRKTGGKVIAQDEATSEFFGMPSAAIATGCVDWIMPIGKIASAVVALVREGRLS